MTDLEEMLGPLNDILPDIIQLVYMHPVTYELVWKHTDDKFISFLLENFRFKDTHIRVVRGEENESETYHYESAMAGCEDDEYECKINNSKGVMLRELVEGIYNMKVSKYDYEYELFNSISIVKKPKCIPEVAVLFTYVEPQWYHFL